MKTSHIHLIDDDDLFRQSVTYMLDEEAFTVHAYSSAAAFLSALDGGEPVEGVIVSDIRMPEMSGLELQAELRKRGVELPLIFMTAHGDVAIAVEAMRHGAADFLEKPFPAERLVASIDAAAARSVPGTERAGKSGASMDVETLHRIDSLSPREKQVFELVLQGKLNKTIADILSISIKTVEMHRANMMAKMQAKALSDLIRMSVGYVPQATEGAMPSSRPHAEPASVAH